MTWPLYLSEDEMARFVLGDRADRWPENRALDSKRGLPPIDPVRGGRFRPHVEEFYRDLADRQAGRIPAVPYAKPLRPDGENHFDAAAETPIRSERRARGNTRARA